MAERPGMTDGAPVPGSGPLAGVVVVDLTRVLAGPYCTMMLSDLGARVIKIERPGTGDDSRHIGPFINGVSAYFASLNRGKESIALDLRADEDRSPLRSAARRGRRRRGELPRRRVRAHGLRLGHASRVAFRG